MSLKGAQLLTKKETSLPTPKSKSATNFAFRSNVESIDESSNRQTITALQADLDRRQADYIKKERQEYYIFYLDSNICYLVIFYRAYKSRIEDLEEEITAIKASKTGIVFN